MPSGPTATASPSMMQERDRNPAIASTSSGNRGVRSLPWSAVEPHPFVGLTRDEAETVVLDFVHPGVAGGRLRGLDRKAGRYETDSEGTWSEHGAPNIEQNLGASRIEPAMARTVHGHSHRSRWATFAPTAASICLCTANPFGAITTFASMIALRLRAPLATACTEGQGGPPSLNPVRRS
jgi:hypothetical protein